MTPPFSEALIFISVFIALAILSLLLIKFIKKFINHEHWQTTQIKEQQRHIALLESQLSVLNPVSWPESAFNYFAIGNSITQHGKCSYWWNEIGMAASREEKDYFHLVTRWLSAQHKQVFSLAYNFAVWEVQSHDRSQLLKTLDAKLNPKIHLITIQLSENANDLSTFSEDLTELIAYVHARCPQARLLLIDDFWDSRKSAIKAQVAAQAHIDFISLDKIRNDKNAQCGIGTVVFGDDGTSHKVEHTGVATHPGDVGMQYIADSIIAALSNSSATAQ